MCIETDREGGGNEKRTSKFGIYEIRGPKFSFSGGPKISRPALAVTVRDF
jgi:hypothetical protein